MENKEKDPAECVNTELTAQQNCTAGLTANQIVFAEKQINFFKDLGVAVPYRLIRDVALEKYK